MIYPAGSLYPPHEQPGPVSQSTAGSEKNMLFAGLGSETLTSGFLKMMHFQDVTIQTSQPANNIYLFPHNLHTDNIAAFVYSVPFRLIYVKVRVWEPSKPFGFLFGPRGYLYNTTIYIWPGVQSRIQSTFLVDFLFGVFSAIEDP